MQKMHKPSVVHLVDDTTAGGVMRVIEHVITSPALAAQADHKVERVCRGKISFEGINADIIVSHLSISWRTLPALLALSLRHPWTKLVHVEHSYTRGFVEHNVGNARRFTALLRMGFALFDRVVAVSAAQQQWITERSLIPKRKLTLIRSYADLGPFLDLPAPREQLQHFGAIGRLDRQKGFDLLITAFRKSKNRNLRLSVFGTGDEEAALRVLAQGDPRISFEGRAVDPVAAFRDVDAVVMPSRWEAYGLVAIEALSAGRQLFCSNVDGLNDQVRIGAQVICIDEVDFDGLASGRDQSSGKMPMDRKEIVEMLAAENVAGWRTLCAA